MIFALINECVLGQKQMVGLQKIREFLLSLPDVTEGTSWDAVSFKVNKKAILFWNPKFDCPVFKVSFEERDFLLEFESETFFTTDHHRPWPLILGRPEKLDWNWVEANLKKVWRAQVSKKTLKLFDENEKGGQI